MHIVTADAAVAIIRDGDWIIPGGFGCFGHPDSLTKALARRFLATGKPRDLSLFFASGAGDQGSQGRGLDLLAEPGLVSRSIGGFYGFCPRLTKLALEGAIEAHNWPQGVMCRAFSALAAGQPGVTSRIGLGTFVDPRVDDSIFSGHVGSNRVTVTAAHGKEHLYFPLPRLHVALLRGSCADPFGNICIDGEAADTDVLAQAMAVKACGGTVIVEVREIVPFERLTARQIRVPGFLVDYVVLSAPGDHPRSYGAPDDDAFVQRLPPADLPPVTLPELPLAKRIILARAALLLETLQEGLVNFGIGIPAFIGMACGTKRPAGVTLSVESGAIGGTPAQGLSFGATAYPEAFLPQSALFDLYESGGLQASFLGFGEIDATGAVNVSRFGARSPGAGGFINISQSARTLIFCGTTSTNGLDLALENGRLRIRSEGRTSKIVSRVAQITFNPQVRLHDDQRVSYITERCVFELHRGELVLCEIAPGCSIDDIRRILPFDIRVAPSLREMPAPGVFAKVANANPHSTDGAPVRVPA